jgi:histidinol dehydrogenase
MRILSGHNAVAEVQRLSRRASQLNKLEPEVRRIVNDVRRGGDDALRRYAQRWDGLAKGQSLRVSTAEIDEAVRSLAPDLRRALSQSAANIRRFCKWQMPKTWRRTRAGISLAQIVRPLESVGCYVPGGRYPLVSTLLMTVIPAQVAGVINIRVVSPKPSREVLGAAAMLGVQEIYQTGGAQAIAALAYGTKSIPRVNKIVGPGNAYVTAAKKLVSFDCAIDFLAGPTEAIVLSDSGTPQFVAADLVSQSEHDPDALALFITTSRALATSVARSVAELARDNAIACESLRRRGAILVASGRSQAREWANQIAPEHITIEPEDLPFIHNAGSVFVGDYSPQAAGDYASGPNHVLPTEGQARFRGGLSVLDFIKIITVQELSRNGLRRIARTVTRIAETEHLQAHAQSIQVRSAHA